MIKINSFEKKILEVLLRSRGWLNTSQISVRGKMSWNTADKYLCIMNSRGWLSRNKHYWKANV